MRKEPLENGKCYHILTKSIAGFVIFNDETELMRMINLLRFYQNRKPLVSFSQFNRMSLNQQNDFLNKNNVNKNNELVEIVCYCIMPTHPHLLLQQLINNGISLFMNNILNSYTRYFNLKHHRKGPLWESRFKNILVKNERQLLHLTRYIHLNPVSAGLVNKPEDWSASSYKEYLGIAEKPICRFDHLIDMKPQLYTSFVNNRISYQRQLTRIKKLILEQP